MVCTDFGCHSFWVDPEVNYYFGATENVAQCLRDYGVKNEAIAVTGIPIEEKFAAPLDKAKLAEKFGLKPGVFTILIVGGQFNFETLSRIINNITAKHDGNVQFLVVAGRDKYLKESLDKSNLNDKYANVKIFGFIDYMQELMTVSDVIFSKAGGLTVSECLAKGLPLIINKVIPGQEEDNVVYLVGNNAAVKVNDVEGIIAAIDDLISHPDKVKGMHEAAGRIGQPHSAENLADFVYNRIK
jgi:processive 1,2-diacylglycerol beta-glucosyltransferase